MSDSNVQNEYMKNKIQILSYIHKTELYKDFCDDIEKDIEIFEKSLKMFQGQVDKELVVQFIKSLRNIRKYYDCEIKKE